MSNKEVKEPEDLYCAYQETGTEKPAKQNYEKEKSPVPKMISNPNDRSMDFTLPEVFDKQERSFTVRPSEIALYTAFLAGRRSDQSADPKNQFLTWIGKVQETIILTEKEK